MASKRSKIKEKLPSKATVSLFGTGEENFHLRDQLKDGTFEEERVCKFSEENIHPILIRESIDGGNGVPWVGNFLPQKETDARVLERNALRCRRGKLFTQYFSVIDILFEREWHLLLAVSFNLAGR